jgi:hypothetical protein
MLYINDQLPHVQQAKRKHIQYITCYINRKLYGKSAGACNDTTCKICKSGIRKMKISSYILSRLRQISITDIIGSAPQDLLKLNRQFNALLSGASGQPTNKTRKVIEKIFSYEWFINKDNRHYNAYDLCNSLKIETCVYCNRLYTSTVITEKGENIIRPTLDHWFPQSEYPLLTLSFYNLIPSCSPCNSSVKHAVTFDLNKNIHPYVDKDITNEYQLHSNYDTSLNTFKITVDSKNVKISSTLKAMQIAAIYEHHQSELTDLDLLRRKYNKRYLSDLGRLLGKRFTEKQVYRIVFGVEYEDENFYKRPLSKLKKDILNIKI